MPGKTHIVLSVVLALALAFVFIVANASSSPWVSVAYFRTTLESALRVYRVVREKSRWVCLGQIVQMAPA
jgi:hypothetical protein